MSFKFFTSVKRQPNTATPNELLPQMTIYYSHLPLAGALCNPLQLQARCLTKKIAASAVASMQPQ
jgi:hypothetical protein